MNRRQIISQSALGFGTIALQSMLHADGLAAGLSDFAPKARSVIWMFCAGNSFRVIQVWWGMRAWGYLDREIGRFQPAIGSDLTKTIPMIRSGVP